MKLWTSALALAMGTFMQVLDSTIANVSLPTICGNLGVSSENGTWVITAFAVANAVMVPLTGWLMMRYGVVRVFFSAVVTFTIASALCGIAWNLPALVVFRVLQGAFSGPMIPGSQALLVSIFPSERRTTALTVWSMTTMVGPIFGPVLGGYISDNFYWGWIFFINIPFGILAAGLTWKNLADRETPTRKLPIDTGGLVLLTFWVFSCQSMLDLGKDRDWFSSPTIVVLGLCASIGFVAWLIWELTEERPAVDLSLFLNRNFTIGCLSVSVGYAVIFANNLLLPVWLQTQMGYTAMWAGLVSAPAGVVAVAVSPLLGRIKLDPRLIASIAFVAFGINFLMRSNYTPDASFWTLSLPLFVLGVGYGTLFVPLTAITLDGIPPERIPSASGVWNFCRIVTAPFSASLMTTYWDRREALHQSRLVDVTTATSPVYREALEHLERIGMSPLQAIGSVMHEIVTQSYLVATLELSYFSGWASFAGILLVWSARKPKPTQGAARPPIAD